MFGLHFLKFYFSNTFQLHILWTHKFYLFFNYISSIFIKNLIFYFFHKQTCTRCKTKSNQTVQFWIIVLGCLVGTWAQYKLDHSDRIKYEKKKYISYISKYILNWFQNRLSKIRICEKVLKIRWLPDLRLQ